ncbi:hypothetical protein LIER_06077 [Lithospermum erythrorhizon]|uniref:EF-hand domain-containing protein n=1 Tax=Lithospermum erythrorhizon TaxID=34254 RepID=A0AAV3P5L1_LITER
MDEDGDDAITLEELMERTGLIWAEERIKKKYRGVHQQKSGRWGAVIRDDNDSPIIQHLFDSQGFLKSLWEEPLPDPGIESHNNLEVEPEKLEDSPRKIQTFLQTP